MVSAVCTANRLAELIMSSGITLEQHCMRCTQDVKLAMRTDEKAPCYWVQATFRCCGDGGDIGPAGTSGCMGSRPLVP